MKQCVRCNNIKPENSFYKDKRASDGLFSSCKECYKGYYERDREAKKKASSQYYHNNKDRVIERVREYYNQNRDAILERGRDYGKEYRKQNVSKLNAKSAQRRASKIKATPVWADKQKINAIYAMSKWLSEVVPGCKYHVDHVIPLKGKNVCGLHIHNNLAIIKDYENFSKSNKFEIE